MPYSNICVDIVLPVYNVAPYIKECLDSIQQQSHANFRAILVNDGSTDNSQEICEAYAQADKRFSVISQPNQGVVQARLTGAQAGQNEWLTFVDPDDYLTPDYLSTLLAAQTTSQADFVIAQYYELHISSQGERQQTVFRADNGIFEREALMDFYKKRILYSKEYLYTTVQLYPWAKLLRRELAIEALQKTLGLTFGEDMVANLYMIQQIDKLHIIEQPIYYYRLNREGQASKTTNLDKALATRINTWERLRALDSKGWLKDQQAHVMWLSLRSFLHNASRQVGLQAFKQHFSPILKYPLYQEMLFNMINKVAITKMDLLRLSLLKYHLLTIYYFLHKKL